jgi:spheroidene monooxygenase
VVAALTYAQIRPSRLFQFYVRSFPTTARQAIGDSSAMLAGIGFGDVPVRHACTVSFWPTAGDVDAFAYGSGGPHGGVQRRSKQGGWLSESLFARFAVSDHSGSWAGCDPLADLTGRSSIVAER